jgi:hypothetical protein
MRQFIIGQSKHEFTSHSGMALIGQCLRRYTDLKRRANIVAPMRHGIGSGDVVAAYVGLLCQGKTDYEAIENFRDNRFFREALGINDVPSEGTVRQRFDDCAKMLLPEAAVATVDFLMRSRAPVSPLPTGHVGLDIDLTTLDNSNSNKEGVSYTYQGYAGYGAMGAYLGVEGWNIGMELREGSDHSQQGFPAFLVRVIDSARRITSQRLLVRLDSAHDAAENLSLLHARRETTDHIIKRNWRRRDTMPLVELAESRAQWTYPRPGKRIGVFSIYEAVTWEKKTHRVRSVIRVTERTIDKRGQLQMPAYEVDGWWSSLRRKTCDDQTVIALYKDHGTSEQYHSELKTDMDVERLPSGKFDSNALVLQLSALTYNLLRYQGQRGLMGDVMPMRNPIKRRRIKTVIQELIYLAAMVVDSGRRLKLLFSHYCPAYRAFKELYTGSIGTAPAG